jgi:hypothetical protein
MSHTQKLRKRPQIFRRLTGISPEKFDWLLSKISPLYEAWNEKRLSRPDRKRAIGGGRSCSLDLSDRLLMLLMYYRMYTTHMMLGFIFGIDDSNVSRNINPIEPFLAQVFRIPERRIRMSEDELLELFFDGTEQPVQRPKRGQKKYYSGKKKRHTIKAQVVVARKKKKTGPGKKKRKVRIAAVSKTYEGRIHDKEIYDRTKAVTPPGVEGSGDTGYQGTVLTIPHKKPRGRELTMRKKKYNRNLSRKRIVVEHGIGKMKTWKIAADRYRNKRRKHSLMFKNVAGLHNLMYA